MITKKSLQNFLHRHVWYLMTSKMLLQGGWVRRAWVLRVVAAGQLGVGRRVHLEIRALLRGLQ
jgi:hypothetical protein